MNSWKLTKRILAGLLSVVLFLSLVPVTPAIADESVETLCTCTPVDGIHAEDCALYVDQSEKPECT